MNPRRLAGPERLEERIDMNADPITTEYLPTAHGTAEVGSAQWQTILSATHANIVHHFESDQAGEQRHLWSGNFYGWEGIAEFDPSLPEGAVIDGAVLRVLIVNAEDTMNRQPSLVAHLSSQDQAGEIATSEYNNAGVALGSVPFAQMTPGAYVDIPLNPSFIPTTGAISLSLRTSDQIAGLQPVDSHNSRSVISYSGMKLELRYHVPDTNPEPDIVNDIVLPEELADLLAEAIVLSRNGPEWRTPETGETQASALRKGYRLNLWDAEAPVVGIRATVAASNGTTLTAYVYRNAELLRTSQVGTDGAFSYDYEEGFTDVVFTTTNDSTVTVSNLTINTDESLETIAGETIDPFSSKPLGIAAAPAVPLPTSISYVAGKLKFYNTSTIGGESRRYIVRDPSQYTLIRAMMSAGSGKISMIGTIRKDGVDYMGREYGSTSGFPDGYARWISENAVVIAPGAPAPISFIVGAYGSKGSIIVSEAGSLETLLPPATMTAATVNSDLMKMNDQFETPGIFAPYSEIREGSSPTFSRPGDIANVQYHIRNEALAGGQVTARVYVGWYSGEPTRGTLQQTETFSMAGGQTVRLSANVSAPAKPDDATSERPIISVVLTMPDGTTVQNTKLGKEPKSHEKIVKTVNGLMRIESQEYTRREQAHINEVSRRALEAVLNATTGRLVAIRDTLGADHVMDLLVRNAQEALALADQSTYEQAVDIAMAELDQGIEKDAQDLMHDREGVGGSENLPPNTEKLLTRGIDDENIPLAAIEAANTVGLRSPSSIYSEALTWTIPSGHTLADDFTSRYTSTVSGKMLTAGIMQMHSNRGNETAQWKTAFMLQAITDIPAEMLMNVANAGLDNAVKRNFDALLKRAQYTHLTIDSPTPAMPAIVMASPNKMKYEAGDEHIRIRFDVGGSSVGVRSVQVYENGSLLEGARSIGFITVPIAKLPSRVPPTTGTLPEFVEATFTMKIVLEDGTVIQRDADSILIDIHLPDALRNPPNGNEGENENINDVTALIRDHFPLGNAANYYMNLGSSYHDGNEYYAADLNSLGGTDTDRGQVVKAIASGTIRFGNSGSYTGNEASDLKIGVIVIDHGEGLQSGYMHMPIFKGALKPHPTTGVIIQHYEVRQHEPIYAMVNGAQQITGMRLTGNIIEFYDGMLIEQDAPIGYVGGRNGGSEETEYNERLNNAHSHFFVKKNGTSVNLWPGLSAAGMTVVKAYDTGPDGIPDTPWPESDEYTISVRFDTTLNAWVNDALKLVVNRSNQEPLSPGVQTGQYFMAWEGNDLTTMKKVVWTLIDPTANRYGWIAWDSLNNSALLLNGKKLEWTPALSSLWTEF